MFQKISDTLPKALKGTKAEPLYIAVKAEEIISKTLPYILPPNTEKDVKFITLKENAVILQVSSSCLAQEIYLNSREIIDKINFEFGRKAVERVRFRVC